MNKMLSYINRMDIMKMYHFFIFLFMLSTMINSPLIKVPIVLVAFLNLVFKNKILEKYSVVFYALNFIGSWYMSYYSMANHRSLLGVFTLYMVYRLWFKDKEWNFPFYLLSLVIVVATFQKILSSYFVNGNLIGELFLSGTSFSQIGYYIDPYFSENTQLFINQFYDLKYTHQSIPLEIADNSVLFSKIFTWVVLISEIILSIAMIVLSRTKKYYAILFFLIGTALFRNEFGFFCTLTLISCFDTKIQNLRIQQLLKILFIVFAVIFCFVSYSRL
jgi:hypothetical protein